MALNYWKTCFLDDLSDGAIEALAAQYADCPSPMSKLIVERPHGAALRRAPEATAFPHRSPGLSVLILAEWRDPDAAAENIAWAHEKHRRLAGFAAPGTYSNYLDDDEGAARVAPAFGGDHARLRALKARNDSQNLFHLNHSAPPLD